MELAFYTEKDLDEAGVLTFETGVVFAGDDTWELTIDTGVVLAGDET